MLIKRAITGPGGQVRLVFPGSIPSKKNQLLPGGHKTNLHYDPQVKATLEGMVWQARGQWGDRKPLVHPAVDVYFFFRNDAQDADNVWTTVLDVLKKARVIVDDSAKWFNGTKRLYPAVVVPKSEARVEVVLWGKSQVINVISTSGDTRESTT